MTRSNKKRLIQNIILLLIVSALFAFVFIQQKSPTEEYAKTLYDKTIGDNAHEILIHVEGRDDILLKNENNIWKAVQPSEFIADKEKVRHLFTLLSENAETSYAIEGLDLANYGLDEDRLSVSFNNVKLIFGKYNAVAQKRYILKGDTMYLVSETVSGLLKAGVDGFKSDQPVQAPLEVIQ